jgi:hypothetical protein
LNKSENNRDVQKNFKLDRNGTAGIQTIKLLSESMLENFTRDFGSRDKVKCEVLFMEE